MRTRETVSRNWHRIFLFACVPQRVRQTGIEATAQVRCGKMTTLQQIELHCPICESTFRSQAVVSTNSFGGKRTDFHERAAGTQPLPYLVHTCNRCGYSGAERDFHEDAEVPAVLRERVGSELAPCITCGTLSGSDKYEAAAKVAEW